MRIGNKRQLHSRFERNHSSDHPAENQPSVQRYEAGGNVGDFMSGSGHPQGRVQGHFTGHLRADCDGRNGGRAGLGPGANEKEIAAGGIFRFGLSPKEER